jgi:hypothetical protein
MLGGLERAPERSARAPRSVRQPGQAVRQGLHVPLTAVQDLGAAALLQYPQRIKERKDK